MCETIQRVVKELPDSIELGKAGNRIKVYVDFSDPSKATEKILKALEILREMSKKLPENGNSN